MARRKSVDADADVPATERETPSRQSRWRLALSVARWPLAAMILLLGCIWLLWQARDFLDHDPRFRVPTRAADEENEAVRVTGIHRASRFAVEAVFDRDRGLSLFECDPARRRLQLRGVEWVKDATVRRVWPNHIEVQILERTPVAFVRVAGGVTNDPANPVVYRPKLIDEEGVLLPLQGAVPSSLPLLTGVVEDSDADRRQGQVKLMQRVLRNLRQYRSQISEVDVTQREEVRIACQIGNQSFNLILGNEQFRERVGAFLEEYERMRGQFDSRKEYDLTNENRIIAIDPEPAPEKAHK
jgi:cell division septal protein FtsQ